MDEHRFDDELHGDSGSPPPIADEAASGNASSRSVPEPARSEPPSIRTTDPAVEIQHEIERLTAVARAKAAAVAVAEAELVDAVAALRAFEGSYVATWRQWTSWQCGLTSGDAARICRLADKLTDLPKMADALRTGRLSAGVTDVLARDATPASESSILGVAEVATGRQLEQLVRDHRRARRDAHRRTPADDAIDPATAPSQASWGWGDDGRHRGSWDLRPDEGATVEAALEAALAHLRPSEAAIDGEEHGSSPEPSGDVETASETETAGSDPDAAPAPVDEHEPGVADGRLRDEERPRCRRSDALVGLASSFLAGEADDGLLPESTQIIVHREHRLGAAARGAERSSPDRPDLPDLRGRGGACRPPDTVADGSSTAGLTDPVMTLPGCGTLDPRVAEILSCDALVLTVDLIAGFPASVATAARSFNRSQRRAMRARDRHCRFPGCARTRHLHAHHTKPYAATHRTSVADGILLCAQHHALIHLRGHTITLGLDHQVTVTRADGSVLRGVALPPPTQIDRPATPPADRRLTGTHEPLTTYARDVIVEHWLAADPPDPPDQFHGPDRAGPDAPAPP